jgi:CheY-like chemotaxis protein
MKFDDMGLAFSHEYLHTALLVSLLSVWALVGLFYYYNLYARREEFSLWTSAWLFYALWLTLTFCLGNAKPGSVLFTINQSFVSLAAGFLLWGSLRFLGLPVRQKLLGAVGIFLGIWILAGPRIMTNPLQIHMPVFILLAFSSPFAGLCFFRLRKQKSFAGVGMLSLGFLLWDIYLGSYPFPQVNGNLYSAGFCVAAALQLFIAVSMNALIFLEVQRNTQAVRAEIEAARLEKEALEFKVIAQKEEYRTLYNQMRATDANEKTVTEHEHLQAMGQMTGDVAHDINNALSPVIAYSEMLLSTLPNLPKIPRQRLQRINQAAEQVAHIVAHMREFYRPASDNNCQPAAESDPKPKLDPDLPNDGPCRPLRILCIDDEPQVGQVLQDVLELGHHRVTIAASGREGLELFRCNLHAGQPYEVVITDLAMPEIDGCHVARAIKAESPQTSVLMLTGWGAMMKTDGQTAPDVDAVLGKPPRMQELNNLLFQITNRNAEAS